ncbi:hypothetical protein [Pimelobacter simplex]|uniref:hypothetical protein n=1 Tax=Nocardioides simplex TaxID=2045 RepID=UPI003AAACDCC
MATPLTPSQLRRASVELLTSGTFPPIATSITTSTADQVPQCREALNVLRAAVQSADSALINGQVINRMSKLADGKEVKGTWATPAQDSLRAAVLFAGAGLDRSLKRLAEDTLMDLVDFDELTNKRLHDFSEQEISAGDAIDPKSLIALLLARGATPREMLVNRWIYSLGAASAQSASRVREFASALGVVDKDIRKRIEPTDNKGSKLEKAFSARNEIAHELDVKEPEAGVRQRLERIRRSRSLADAQTYVVEMLDVTQVIINDVARRLTEARD